MSWVTVRVVGLLLQNVDLGVLFSILMGLNCTSEFWLGCLFSILRSLLHQSVDLGDSSVFMVTFMFRNCWMLNLTVLRVCKTRNSERELCVTWLLMTVRHASPCLLIDSCWFSVFYTVFYKLSWCPSFFSGTSVRFWYLIYCWFGGIVLALDQMKHQRKADWYLQQLAASAIFVGVC